MIFCQEELQNRNLSSIGKIRIRQLMRKWKTFCEEKEHFGQCQNLDLTIKCKRCKVEKCLKQAKIILELSNGRN